MSTLTDKQIEQKKQLLSEKLNQMKSLFNELVEAGAIEIPEEYLTKVAGGCGDPEFEIPSTQYKKPPTIDQDEEWKKEVAKGYSDATYDLWLREFGWLKL